MPPHAASETATATAVSRRAILNMTELSHVIPAARNPPGVARTLRWVGSDPTQSGLRADAAPQSSGAPPGWQAKLRAARGAPHRARASARAQSDPERPAARHES